MSFLAIALVFGFVFTVVYITSAPSGEWASYDKKRSEKYPNPSWENRTRIQKLINFFF